MKKRKIKGYIKKKMRFIKSIIVWFDDNELFEEV